MLHLVVTCNMSLLHLVTVCCMFLLYVFVACCCRLLCIAYCYILLCAVDCCTLLLYIISSTLLRSTGSFDRPCVHHHPSPTGSPSSAKPIGGCLVKPSSLCSSSLAPHNSRSSNCSASVSLRKECSPLGRKD
jgi:hypothetical protein